jgi:hypothetical protein
MVKQWSVRVVTSQADFCFVSSFSAAGLPEVRDEDLLEVQRAGGASTACDTQWMKHNATAELPFPHILGATDDQSTRTDESPK